MRVVVLIFLQWINEGCDQNFLKKNLTLNKVKLLTKGLQE